eukprot:jgi/Tetstr1/449770/TSEL_036834.t1
MGGAPPVSGQALAFDEFVLAEAAAWQQQLGGSQLAYEQQLHHGRQDLGWTGCSYTPAAGLKRTRGCGDCLPGRPETPSDIHNTTHFGEPVSQDAALGVFVHALHARYMQYGKCPSASSACSPTAVLDVFPSRASSMCSTPDAAYLGAWAPSAPVIEGHSGWQYDLPSPLKRLRVDASQQEGHTWQHFPAYAPQMRSGQHDYAARSTTDDLPLYVHAHAARQCCIAPDVGLSQADSYSQATDLLGRWGAALPIEDPSTVPFGFHLWCRVACQASAQNRLPLDALLGACLWIACKLQELRMFVPGAATISCLSGVPVGELRRAEKTVMGWLSWAPLSNWNKL